ncbi:MAG: GIY-YIG nuclease family protein [Pseudomonadota bacterium]
MLGRGLVAQKNSKLAPKHEGAFSGAFGDHAIWFVYVLALKDQRGRDLAFKIGYANDPAIRLAAYRAPMAVEVTGLTWELASKQPTGSEDEARRIEQGLLAHFAKHKLASNGEIISGPSQTDIMSKMAVILRQG